MPVKPEKSDSQSQKMSALARMAARMAHDFNNILGAIEGYASLILAGLPPDDPMRPDIEEIRKAEQRAAAITKQLMIFGRKHSSHRNTVDINRLVTGFKMASKEPAGECIEIDLEMASDLKPVQADQVQLEHALGHLVDNAREATSAGGKIKIKTASVDFRPDQLKCPSPPQYHTDFIEISVIDTGEGMSEEVMERMFEPFFTTSTKGLGRGLGLSVVYGIVNQHNGWVTARSEPGKGSVFSIYLPAAPAEAGSSGPCSHERTCAETGKPAAVELKSEAVRVLVIESDKALRELTGRMLEETGYSPTAAANAEEAEKILASGTRDFKIIFSDMDPASGKGAKLIEKLRLEDPAPHFVFTGGPLYYQNTLELMRGQGYKFVEKPYSIETVLQVFKDLLGSR